MAARVIVLPLAPIFLRLAPAGRLGRVRRGRRRHAAVEARLLLVVERAIERLQLRLDRVVCRKGGGEALLRRLEPRRGRGRNVLRALGGEPLRGLLGGIAQAFERLALVIVGADRTRYRLERPVVELGGLRGTAAGELIDGRAERAAAAAVQHEIAALGRSSARQVLAIAPAAAIIVAGAPAIGPPILPAVRHAILGAVLRAVRPVLIAARRVAGLRAIVSACLAARVIAIWFAVLPLRLARTPLVERASGGIPLAVAAIIAVVTPPGVGARGRARHQHRRNQHARCPHG